MIHLEVSSQAGLGTFEPTPIPADVKAHWRLLAPPLVEPTQLADDAITSVPKAA